jgi:hypothetical protein
VDASSDGTSGFYTGDGHVLNLTTLRVGQDPVLLDEVDIFIGVSGLLVVPDRFAFKDETLELQGSLEGAGDFFVQGTGVLRTRSTTSSPVVVPVSSSLVFSETASLDVFGPVHVQSAGSVGFGVNTTVQGSGQGHARQVTAPGCVQSGYGVGGAHGGNTQNFFGGYGTGTGSGCGNYLEPTTQGSGGRDSRNYYGHNVGGNGGTAVRFTVTGAAVFDGLVHVNGADAPAYTTASCNHPAGGGAGGSLWLDVGSLSGSTAFQSNGGRGTNAVGCCGGAGSGGRIAVYTSDATGWSGSFEASGWALSSDSRCNAPAGTVFTKVGGQELLAVDNGAGANPTRLHVQSLLLCSGECVVQSVALRNYAQLGVLGASVGCCCARFRVGVLFVCVCVCVCALLGGQLARELLVVKKRIVLD